MSSTLAPPLSRIASPATVRTLVPRDVPALRLPGLRGDRGLRQSLESLPGRSVWVPDTLEYALIGSWRNRSEIASVDELVAVRHTEALLRAAFERCVEHGDELMLAVELESPLGQSRYERAGLEMLEEVITYEMSINRSSPVPSTTLRPMRVNAGDKRAIDQVIAIDQASFPWLWQNNRAEFDVYLRTPGVEVTLLEHQPNGEPIAYLGATLFPGWGHLDRIAVAPGVQGRGHGREALALAVTSMRQHGARRIALSTQRSNQRSQRLYERFGFRRTLDLDYKLFGAWCQPHRAQPLPFA